MKTASTRLISSTVALVAVLIPGFAAAELRSEMTAFVVTQDATGIEQYAPADSVKPGQLIEYRISHRNTFDNAVDGVAIVGPVPAQAVVNLTSTQSSSDALLEVRGELDPDSPGEEWSTLPAQRIVILSDGSRLIEPAQPEDFTAVRWKLSTPLASQEVVTNTYRVRVK